MKTLVSVAGILALLAVPGAAGAADPAVAGKVEVTYDDAVRCASIDTALAIALTSDEGNVSKEDQDRADTLSAFADMWLNQASYGHEGGQEAVLKDITEMATGFFLKLADPANNPGFQEQFGEDWGACQELEAAVVASIQK